MTKFRPVHPFPARMAPELVWEEMPEDGKRLRVLDPMSGSGTTLVAARLRGHKAVGLDMDPLAVLIANTWIADIDPIILRKKALEVLERAKLRRSSLKEEFGYPSGSNAETRKFIDFWFDTENRMQLSSLAATIKALRDTEIKNVMWCALSRLIITKTSGVSLAMDVSHSRPHKAYKKAPHLAFDRFIYSVEQVLKFSPFEKCSGKPAANVLAGDAREMPIDTSSIDLIITSPPYLNAIDYLRGHKLSLVWMGHNIADLRILRSTNVGSEVSTRVKELENPLADVLERMCSGDDLSAKNRGMLMQYVSDLDLLLTECHRVLKPGGKAVFVLGDCNIKNSFISNSTAVQLICDKIGFKFVSSRKRPLPENRRYLPPPDTTSSGLAMQKRMREEVILAVVK